MFKPSGLRKKIGVGRGGPILANAKSQRPTMSDLASRQCVRVLRFVVAVPILRLSAKSALTICVTGMHMLYNARMPKRPRLIQAHLDDPRSRPSDNGILEYTILDHSKWPSLFCVNAVDASLPIRPEPDTVRA